MTRTNAPEEQTLYILREQLTLSLLEKCDNVKLSLAIAKRMMHIFPRDTLIDILTNDTCETLLGEITAVIINSNKFDLFLQHSSLHSPYPISSKTSNSLISSSYCRRRRHSLDTVCSNDCFLFASSDKESQRHASRCRLFGLLSNSAIFNEQTELVNKYANSDVRQFIDDSSFNGDQKIAELVAARAKAFCDDLHYDTRWGTDFDGVDDYDEDCDY